MQKNYNESRKLNYVWVLAGVYLLYLGGKLGYDLITGAAELQIWKFFIAAIFLAIGAFLCLREWKLYKTGKTGAKQNDELPDSYYNNIEDNFEEEYEKEKTNVK